MRFFTVHAPRPGSVPETAPRPPVLVRDGFSGAAFLFGPFWFLVHRLWVEAVIVLALNLVILFALPDAVEPYAAFALALLVGFEARDAQRRRLERRGMPVQTVIAAPDPDFAWFRLAQQRPDLVRAMP